MVNQLSLFEQVGSECNVYYLRESPLYQLYSLACNKSVVLALCKACLVESISSMNSFCWEFLIEIKRMSPEILDSLFDLVLKMRIC